MQRNELRQEINRVLIILAVVAAGILATAAIRSALQADRDSQQMAYESAQRDAGLDARMVQLGVRP
jgi:hypothetical protein